LDPAGCHSHPVSLLEHAGAAVGAVAAAPQPPLQAARVENMPAAKPDEPVGAVAPLQAYRALGWRLFVSAFSY
jgi:hypothetical protein